MVLLMGIGKISRTASQSVSADDRSGMFPHRIVQFLSDSRLCLSRQIISQGSNATECVDVRRQCSAVGCGVAGVGAFSLEFKGWYSFAALIALIEEPVIFGRDQFG
jgi:hypothetical protein